MHEMVGGSCPFAAGRSGEQEYGVHVNIMSCERLIFWFFLVFVGEEIMGKSVGDDVSCSRSWGRGRTRLILCRLRAFHMISHGKKYFAVVTFFDGSRV